MEKYIVIHKTYNGMFGVRSDIVESINKSKGSLNVYMEDKKTIRVINWDKLYSEKLQELPGQKSRFGKPYKLFMYNAKDWSKENKQQELFK